MKRILLATLMLATPAAAGPYGDAAQVIADSKKYDPSSPMNKMEKHDRCTYQASLAEIIMEGRQAGVPLGNMLKIAETASGKGVAMLVSLAYDQPKFSTDSVQKESVAEFADMTFKACYDND